MAEYLLSFDLWWSHFKKIGFELPYFGFKAFCFIRSFFQGCLFLHCLSIWWIRSIPNDSFTLLCFVHLRIFSSLICCWSCGFFFSLQPSSFLSKQAMFLLALPWPYLRFVKCVSLWVAARKNWGTLSHWDDVPVWKPSDHDFTVGEWDLVTSITHTTTPHPHTQTHIAAFPHYSQQKGFSWFLMKDIYREGQGYSIVAHSSSLPYTIFALGSSAKTHSPFHVGVCLCVRACLLVWAMQPSSPGCLVIRQSWM